MAGMGWNERTIWIEGDTIVLQHWPMKQRVAFNNIEGIFAQQCDMLTYNENFLILSLRGGEQLACGELTRGFKELEAELQNRFPFPADWQTDLESSGPGSQFQPWPHAAKSGSAEPRATVG